MASAASDRGRNPGIYRRNPLCISRLREKFPADSNSTPTRLSPHARREQGGCKGTQAIWPSGVLTGRFTKLSDQVYEEDISLARRKVIAGSLLSMVGTAGYYTAYVYAVWQTVTGVFTFGTLTLLANAIREASSNLQQTFSTLSTIADQALFLTDLIAFFDMQPTIRSKPNALARAAPDQAWIRIPQCVISVSRNSSAGSRTA